MVNFLEAIVVRLFTMVARGAVSAANRRRRLALTAAANIPDFRLDRSNHAISFDVAVEKISTVNTPCELSQTASLSTDLCDLMRSRVRRAAGMLVFSM